jgi:predicted component of type VI protein secretion system
VKSKADASVQNVRHSLNGRVVLGRGADSAVPLEAPGISREHLEVQVEGSALMLIDLSSNGTWLNGARMPQHRKCKVREGDLIELPGYEIQCQLVSAAQSAATVAVPPLAGSANPKKSASPLSGGRARSLLASVSSLELFLVAVVLASVVLLVLYLAS